MKTLDITSDDVDPPDWLPDLSRAARRTLETISIHNYEVSILLCSDTRMTELNSTYRGIAEPTDVLSFSQDEGDRVPPADGAGLCGDVVVSVETVARNASLFGVTPAEEALRVTVHGVLHLAGHDHEGVTLSDPGAAGHPMLGLQEEIVNSLIKEQDE